MVRFLWRELFALAVVVTMFVIAMDAAFTPHGQPRDVTPLTVEPPVVFTSETR